MSIHGIETEGDLNFEISTIIDDYILKVGKTYASMSRMIGLLSFKQQELYELNVRSDAVMGDVLPLEGLDDEVERAIEGAVDEYAQRNGTSRDELVAVLGVMECVKLELYRRLLAPYEDQKLHENGDVFSEENLQQ